MASEAFKDRVKLLLHGLEEGREVRAYLRRFSQDTGGCFAVVKVGGAIVERDLNLLAEALALLQALGLPPVVVFGAGPQLDTELAAQGIPADRVDGFRVTPKEALPTISSASGQMGRELIAAMQARGASGVGVTPGAVRAKVIDESRYGMVGDIHHVDRSAFQHLLDAGIVPLVSCVHTDEQGQLVNVNADNVARAIAEELQPQKVVFVTGTGGILDQDGAIIDSINLAEEGESLFAAEWLRGGMRHKIGEISGLLDRLPSASSVSMVSTEGLIRELFTHTGSGTLVRRGEAIGFHERAEREMVESLIENAFKRTLKASYWESFSPRYTLLSEQRRAGAVVSSIDGVDFLDKFAVLSAARGEGLAKSLWDQLLSHSPTLVWRSRLSNPFNAFYHAHADGSVRRDPWTVFWVGASLEPRMTALADEIASRPGDFEGET
ncbi:MAG: acetylglutamate kinase [Pseudomonadota bacterium]